MISRWETVGFCRAVVVIGFLACGAGWGSVHAAEAGAIRPPTLSAKQVRIALPAKFDDACLGGGGRYLVLHLPSESKLAVFDVSKARVVGAIPTGGGQTLFTAGQDHVVIVKPSDGILQRYDLSGLQRQHTVKATWAGEHPLTLVAMGHASQGPVLVGLGQYRSGSRRYRSRATLLDLKTLKPVGDDLPTSYRVEFERTTCVRASGNGRVFTSWRTRTSPSGMQTLLVSGKTLVPHYEHRTVGYQRPDHSGDLIYTYNGVYSNELKLRWPQPRDSGLLIPAVHGPLFVGVKYGRSGRPTSPSPGAGVTVYAAGHKPEPIVQLTDVQLSSGTSSPRLARVKLPIDKRIFYIPSAGVLVTLPHTDDAVVLRRVDLAEELRASAKDHLVVLSTPPGSVDVGRPFTYTLRVASKPGKPKFKVEDGPEGMTVSSDGTLRWTPRAKPPGGMVNVAVSVTNTSGKAVTHGFLLRVEGPDAVAGVRPGTGSGVRPGPSKPTTVLPTTMTEKQKRIALHTTFDDVCLAGGGRYLLLHLPLKSKLAVFDISRSKIAGYISTGGGSTLFTAGRDDVVIVKPDLGILQRYDLATVTKRLTVKDTWSGQHAQVLVAMGHASQGPVLLGQGQYSVRGRGRGSRATLLDLKTLKPIEYTMPKWYRVDFSRFTHVRASADGTVFATWRTGGSPTGMHTLVLTGRKVVAHYEHKSAGYLRPNASGDLIYSYMGAHTAALKPKWRPRDGGRPIPAVQGTLFVTVSYASSPRTRHRQPSSAPGVTIHSAAGGGAPLVTLKNIAIQSPSRSSAARGKLYLDKRVFYAPDVGVLVVLPQTNDAIVVHRVDLERELRASGVDYLAVLSVPRGTLRVGKPFTYAVRAIAKDPKPKFKLDLAPKGMTVSPEGVLRWTPKAKPIGGTANVVVSVSTASGKSVLHRFDLRVEGPQIAAGTGATPKTGAGLAKVDAKRQEITGGECLPFVDNGDRGTLLLVGGRNLLVLGPDGFSLAKTVTLPNTYDLVGRRRKSIVAVSRTANTVDVIHETTGKVFRTLRIPRGSPLSLALHPLKSVSYVSTHDAVGRIPSSHFLVFNEITGKGRQNESLIGSKLAVDRSGKFLYTGYDDLYRSGSELLMNPRRWHVLPRYGRLNLLLRYSLANPSDPMGLKMKEKSGGSGRGLRISPDGKQLVAVSGWATSRYQGWNPADLDEIPLVYDLGQAPEKINDFAFHPSLPVAAAIGRNTVLMLNTKTGRTEADRADLPASFPKGGLTRLWFSPDGRSVIVLQVINEIPYLYRAALKLSPEEIQKLPKPGGDRPKPGTGGIVCLPRRDRARVGAPAVPATTAPQ